MSDERTITKRREIEVDIADILPEGCISKIISFTSPCDACRSSLVSRIFRSAASSDLVWETFLPRDYQQILSQSESPASSASSSLNALSKKDLYFHLCHNPILVGDGDMQSFAIDKSSGKKCYMLGARELVIERGETPRYWRWISSAKSPSVPKSRFLEVAYLLDVTWLEIRGRIKTKILSQNTRYGAYFVYTIADDFYGLDRPMKVSVKFENEKECKATKAYLPPDTPAEQNGRLPCKREDMWFEIEIGEFFNGEIDSVVEMCLKETRPLNWKSGLLVHGIELRPKDLRFYDFGMD